MDDYYTILNALRYGDDLQYVRSDEQVEVGRIYAYKQNSKLTFRYVVSVSTGHYRFRTMDRGTFKLHERVRIGRTSAMFRLCDRLHDQVIKYLHLQEI
jgi:hypothetical protein